MPRKHPLPNEPPHREARLVPPSKEFRNAAINSYHSSLSLDTFATPVTSKSFRSTLAQLTCVAPSFSCARTSVSPSPPNPRTLQIPPSSTPRACLTPPPSCRPVTPYAPAPGPQVRGRRSRADAAGAAAMRYPHDTELAARHGVPGSPRSDGRPTRPTSNTNKQVGGPQGPIRTSSGINICRTVPLFWIVQAVKFYYSGAMNENNNKFLDRRQSLARKSVCPSLLSIQSTT